jgi:hypothetical protein
MRYSGTASASEQIGLLDDDAARLVRPSMVTMMAWVGRSGSILSAHSITDAVTVHQLLDTRSSTSVRLSVRYASR